MTRQQKLQCLVEAAGFAGKGDAIMSVMSLA